MGWLIVLGVLVFLAILPLGASVRYDSEGVLVRLIAGPVKITLFPRAKKKKSPRKARQEKEQKKEKKTPASEKPDSPARTEKPDGKAQQKQKSGGPWTDFLPLVKVGLDMLGAFRRKLRVNVLELKLIMAGNDPCDLAVNYGKAWAALGNLLPRLERVLVIKKRDLEVECDFTANETLVIARLDLTITLGRLLALGIVYGFRAMIEFLKIKKKRKGGAVK